MKTRTIIALGALVLLVIAVVIANLPQDPDEGVWRPEESERIAELEARIRELTEENERLRGDLAAGPAEEDGRIADRPAEAEEVADRVPPPTGVDYRGTLRVRVVDGNGAPIPGARIYTKYENQQEATTNADGVAELTRLAPGQRYVSVRSEAGKWSSRIEVEPGRTVEVPVTLEVGSAVVAGVVSHRQTGPLHGVSIALHLRSRGQGDRTYRVETDAEGQFRFEDLPAGAYTLTAVGGPLEKGKVLMQPVEVPAGGTVVKDLQAGTVSLGGRVTDAETGAAIPDVSVRTQSPMSRSSVTDAGGRYELLDLMDGEYAVIFAVDGYGIEFVHGVEVAGDGRTLDHRLRKAATLNVIARDPGGRPFVGRLVLSIKPKVKGEGTSVGTGITTNAEGRGVYRQIVPGEYTLRFGTYDRKLSGTVQATVGPGETTVEVTLQGT
jgi:Carboxypeptidase regulatory-like domain